MSRSLRIVVLAAVTVLLALATTAGSAYADPDRLRLSIDPGTPLFTGTETYAPGDHVSTFTLTNDSPSRTLAAVELLRPPPDAQGDLAPFLEFSAAVEGETVRSRWIALDGAAPDRCLVLGSALVAPRDDADVAVTMRLTAAGQAAMDKSADFSFRVTLSQVTHQGKANPCGPRSTGGTAQVLGSQGAAAAFAPAEADPGRLPEPARSATSVLLAAAGLLVAGVALLLAARRGRRS